MAVTEVDICNGALIKLGAERILTLDDNNTRARLVKESYPKMRDLLLFSHPWKFNKSYSQLGQVALPAGVFDYSYAFQLPSDCARVFNIEFENIRWDVIEGGILLSDASTMRIQYGKKITQADKFDSSFREALEWAIAADIAYALTQSTAQLQTAKQGMEMALRPARSYNAQQGTPQQVKANQWLYARRSWR